MLLATAIATLSLIVPLAVAILWARHDSRRSLASRFERWPRAYEASDYARKNRSNEDRAREALFGDHVTLPSSVVVNRGDNR